MADNSGILSSIINAIVGIIQQKIQTKNDPAPAPVIGTDATVEMGVIDWTNPDCMLSKYFSVYNALWLPTWNRMANESDGLNDAVKSNILNLLPKMDQIRERLGIPFNIHCLYRPPAYSPLVGGTSTDVHTMGMAVDFDLNAGGMSTDQVKAALMPLLEDMGLRMEDNGEGADWVHIDIHPVIHNRFFKA